jgi:hypothetical protein
MMTRSRRSSLAAAAALTGALIALPARADHDRGEHRGPPAPAHVSPVTVHPAPPAYFPAPAPVAAFHPARPAHWREGWRARELRDEYRELDQARARFYATWDGRPWTRTRFESWYGARRADLDQRWAGLERWRG